MTATVNPIIEGLRKPIDGMKKIKGVWLPEHDTHFEDHLNKGPTYRGRGTYQMKKILAAMTHVRHRQGALDIGAHVGLWSLYLADHFTRLHAFEPVPDHVKCYRKNMAYYLDAAKPHVTLHQVALGSEEGKAKMATTPDNTGNARIAGYARMAGEGDLAVDVERLDDYVFEAVNFVKVDVEGFELEVIKGGAKLIQAQKPVLVIEQKPGMGQKYGFGERAAVDLVLSWGAKVAWEMGGDFCLTWE
jgi:FkbM family methyltransferase